MANPDPKLFGTLTLLELELRNCCWHYRRLPSNIFQLILHLLGKHLKCTRLLKLPKGHIIIIIFQHAKQNPWKY